MKSSTIYSDKDGVLRVLTVDVPKEPTNVCLRCKGKGWITGIEHPCSCNPGGDWRSSKTAYQRHHEAIQHCKDTSVPFGDQKAARKRIENAIVMANTFYTVPEFESTFDCNADCPDVEFGSCFHPNKCIKFARLVSPQQETQCNSFEPFKKYTAYTDETPTVATVGTEYQPQEPEEQDELWDEVAEVVDTIAPAYRIKRLKEKFTITRKQ